VLVLIWIAWLLGGRPGAVVVIVVLLWFGVNAEKAIIEVKWTPNLALFAAALFSLRTHARIPHPR
jgi:hypothetical protein